MEEVRYHRQKEEEYKKLIKELKQDFTEIKDELNEIRRTRVSSGVRDDFESRVIKIEQRLAEQEQYTRRECVDIVGLPKNLKGEDLEAALLNVFEEAGVPIEKRGFHAIHRLSNTRVVIPKVCNGKDEILIVRNKKKIRQEGKKKLQSQKIYVNESLCPDYKRILVKCNALRKKNMLMHFTQ